MSNHQVRARDIARRLPGIVRKFPSIARGYYYYAVKDENRELTLGTLIERNAERHGRRPAVLFDDRVITWEELNGWANRISHFLQTEGLTKGDAIAVTLVLACEKNIKNIYLNEIYHLKY